MKVMIIVTHLLGTGHLSRALTLGRAFARRDHDVFVVSGGMPAPQLDSGGVTMFGLRPLRSDGTNFTRLLDEKGNPASPDYLAARTKALTQAVNRFEPDVLITELFPFGRRSLSEEFSAALTAALGMARRPVVLASVRDILAPPSKPAKAARTDEILERFYDGVLVHSDPEIVPLDISWPVSQMTREKLIYTGFVAPSVAAPHPDGVGRGEILVSAGGGSVGQPIFRAAIEAARTMPNTRWRLLVGGRDAQTRISELRNTATDLPIALEPVRPDFRQMLSLAAASVSMCGYNTAMDLLQSGVPSVVIPFDDGNEVEQSLRAESLSRQPAIEVLSSTDLTADTLVAALSRTMVDGPRDPLIDGFDGAQKTVQIAERLAVERR